MMWNRLSPSHRYAAILAAVAVLILVLGYVLKPAAHPVNHSRPEDTTVTRAELENLQQLVRRNSLRNISANFTSVSEKVAAHVTAVQPWGTTGVLIPDIGLVVAKPLDALPRVVSVGAPPQPVYPITPKMWVPGIPFFASQIDAKHESMIPARLSDAAP